MNKIEYKTFPFEIKEANDGGLIAGYASTFGNVDQGDDIIEAGAFEKTLKENKQRFPILADHWDQIGWNKSASEDLKGLLVEGWLDTQNNQKAKEKHSLAKKGLELQCPVGLSIGFSPIKFDFDTLDGRRIRRLKEVRLWEYSLVTFPMNQQAMLTAAKSWALKELSLDNAVEALIAAMIEKGYSQSEVTNALALRAAKSNTEPVLDDHSICDGLSKITRLLKAEA